jgi:predicted  nucleic acid-binding Zn-ribbon protein
MFKHLCMKCGKNSYSADETYFSACPYCGCRFSAKYGPDRRRAERFKKETDIALICQGQRLEAASRDFSEEGLGIKVFGEIPVAVGEIIELTTSGLPIKAKIMWTNKLKDEALVGLQRLN